MMKTESERCSSRREFLKKTIKVTGYSIPAMVVFKMGSTRAWAQKYEAQNIGAVGQGTESSDPCKGVFEKIFKTSCW